MRRRCAGVGKTCLFKRYTAGQAIASFEPTIGVEIATKMLNIHGNTVKSLIWVPPSSLESTMAG